MSLILTPENYRGGFLVDEELMGGVTEDSETQGGFVAFVLRHTTGEYLGYSRFPTLSPALEAINSVQRNWAYEKSKDCGACGEGQCTKGACGGGTCKL